jgi:hypothetical protein
VSGERNPSPETIDRIADIIGADATTVTQLSGQSPPVESLDPHDPVERTYGRLKRRRGEPL